MRFSIFAAKHLPKVAAGVRNGAVGFLLYPPEVAHFVGLTTAHTVSACVCDRVRVRALHCYIFDDFVWFERELPACARAPACGCARSGCPLFLFVPISFPRCHEGRPARAWWLCEVFCIVHAKLGPGHAWWRLFVAPARCCAFFSLCSAASGRASSPPGSPLHTHTFPFTVTVL